MSLLQALNLRPPRAPAAPSAKSAGHVKGAEAWLRTHREAHKRIAALKAAAQAHYAGGHPELVQAIAEGLDKLDDVLANVDHRLSDALVKAGAATDETTRSAELQNAKAILTSYIDYVKSTPLVGHIDGNPFNVKTDLKALLVAGLTDAATAIG